MSISYHGVVGHKSKVTLPSVDSWGANMNILRDPPKSIQTRKIDKVGETSDITTMIDESGDRFCENILTYARGVNPMVSVSYSNNGNNGGARVNNVRTGGSHGSVGGKGEAFLPYRVMRDGAFRPPARDQRDLLPLSRQPRVWTSSFTKAGFTDFSKKLFCNYDPEKTKGVLKSSEMLRRKIKPRVSYVIETPLVETYEVKNVIRNQLKVFADSKIGTTGKTTTHFSNPTKEINYNKRNTSAQSNIQGNRKDIDISHFNTERYLQDVNTADINANISHIQQIQSIDELYAMNVDTSTKDQMNIDYTSNKTLNKNNITHLDYDLESKLPVYDVNANTSLNIHKQVVDPVSERKYTMNRPTTSAITNVGQNIGHEQITSTQYNLKPTINAGSFAGEVSKPTIHRGSNLVEFDARKTDMRKKVFDLQQSRGRELVNPYGYSSADAHSQMIHV